MNCPMNLRLQNNDLDERYEVSRFILLMFLNYRSHGHYIPDESVPYLSSYTQ